MTYKVGDEVLKIDFISGDRISVEFINDEFITSDWFSGDQLCPASPEPETCKWKKDENPITHYFHSSCGTTKIMFSVPADWKYCPNCGRKIEVKDE